MAADLQIADGNPVWASPSIMPSSDNVLTTPTAPTLAAVNVNSIGVNVYVNVKNTGTVDFGSCGCTNLGAWSGTVLFTGFLNSKTAAPPGITKFGTRFTAAPIGDSLVTTAGAIIANFGAAATGVRAWDWSPDGNFFAYVSSASGNDWNLVIYALQNLTRPNGTTIAKYSKVVQANGVFGGMPWTSENFFGWMGSKAVIVNGTSAVSGATARALVCPYAPFGAATYGETYTNMPGVIDWIFLVSPCASVVAFVPRILVAGNSSNMYLISTSTAAKYNLTQNNVSITVNITGQNPSITSNAPGAKGVSIATGAAAPILVDNPDCLVVSGGIVVRVDRVKASTLPTGNLGVLPVGTAILGQLSIGASIWVQVPNPSGWANQGEEHWCLLAQAYTQDGVTIPQPWDGQAPAPPAFPIGLENCAQRNIQILP